MIDPKPYAISKKEVATIRQANKAMKSAGIP